MKVVVDNALIDQWVEETFIGTRSAIYLCLRTNKT